jgi:hypothetical protein
MELPRIPHCSNDRGFGRMSAQGGTRGTNAFVVELKRLLGVNSPRSVLDMEWGRDIANVFVETIARGRNAKYGARHDA